MKAHNTHKMNMDDSEYNGNECEDAPELGWVDKHANSNKCKCDAPDWQDNGFLETLHFVHPPIATMTCDRQTGHFTKMSYDVQCVACWRRHELCIDLIYGTRDIYRFIPNVSRKLMANYTLFYNEQ